MGEPPRSSFGIRILKEMDSAALDEMVFSGHSLVLCTEALELSLQSLAEDSISQIGHVELLKLQLATGERLWRLSCAWPDPYGLCRQCYSYVYPQAVVHGSG